MATENAVLRASSGPDRRDCFNTDQAAVRAFFVAMSITHVLSSVGTISGHAPGQLGFHPTRRVRRLAASRGTGCAPRLGRVAARASRPVTTGTTVRVCYLAAE